MMMRHMISGMKKSGCLQIACVALIRIISGSMAPVPVDRVPRFSTTEVLNLPVMIRIATSVVIVTATLSSGILSLLSLTVKRTDRTHH